MKMSHLLWSAYVFILVCTEVKEKSMPSAAVSDQHSDELILG